MHSNAIHKQYTYIHYSDEADGSYLNRSSNFEAN